MTENMNKDELYNWMVMIQKEQTEQIFKQEEYISRQDQNIADLSDENEDLKEQRDAVVRNVYEMVKQLSETEDEAVHRTAELTLMSEEEVRTLVG